VNHRGYLGPLNQAACTVAVIKKGIDTGDTSFCLVFSKYLHGFYIG